MPSPRIRRSEPDDARFRWRAGHGRLGFSRRCRPISPMAALICGADDRPGKRPIPSPSNLPRHIRPLGDVRLSPFLQHDVDHGLPNMFRRCTGVGTRPVDGCVYHLLRGFSHGNDNGTDQPCSAQMKIPFRIIEGQTGCGLPLNLSDEGIGGLFNRRGSHEGYNAAQRPSFICREELM